MADRRIALTTIVVRDYEEAIAFAIATKPASC